MSICQFAWLICKPWGFDEAKLSLAHDFLVAHLGFFWSGSAVVKSELLWLWGCNKARQRWQIVLFLKRSWLVASEWQLSMGFDWGFLWEVGVAYHYLGIKLGNDDARWATLVVWHFCVFVGCLGLAVWAVMFSLGIFGRFPFNKLCHCEVFRLGFPHNLGQFYLSFSPLIERQRSCYCVKKEIWESLTKDRNKTWWRNAY